jgi:hypothetical protein
MTQGQVCSVVDEFLEDKTIWEVKLNNGAWIYQDDNRPDRNPVSAWERLGNLLQLNRVIHIEEMRFRFRDHIEVLPIIASDAYYFSKSIGTLIGGGITDHYYIGGALLKDKSLLKMWKYKIPELILVEEYHKRLNEVKSPNLIYI